MDLNYLPNQSSPVTYFHKLESSNMEKFGLTMRSLLVVDSSKTSAENTILTIRHEGLFYTVY